MATQLDFEEQEQIDQLKAFWKQYGALITTVVTLALLAFSAWQGWMWWQRDQATQAAGYFEALDKAAAASDLPKARQAQTELQTRFPRTAYAQQAGLLMAKLQQDKGDAAAAQASLRWVAEQAEDPAYQTMARLRLAGLLLDAKQLDEALAQLDAAKAPAFKALVADRRGDVLQAQGKTELARAAYREAFDALEKRLDYRRLVESKLAALGAAPDSVLLPAAAASAPVAASAGSAP